MKIRFKRTLALARASWGVLKSDRTLALFPVLSAVLSLAVLMIMAVLGWVTKGSATTSSGDTQYSANAVTAVVAVVGYVGIAFVQTYFLAALVGSANEVFEGRATTVRDGMKIASSRAGRLLPWALVSATVSWILRSLEERAGIVGQIVVGMIGGAWSVLTFLTVPAIVFEDLGPVNALKRSGTLVKATWGENIIAQMGFGLLALPAILVAFGIAFGGIATNVGVVAVVAIAVAVLIVIATTVILAALGGIFRTALYRYAVDGWTPPAFATTHLDEAFAPKSGSSRI